ncbi:MAG: SDR family oxidoreductase [Nitrospinota bacterium]|nr:SDR family oxidoreductase [Nitrospinota bacterium]
MKKILITGATGYVGRRLKDTLLDRPDISIRLLVRNKKKLRAFVLDKVEIVEGDTYDKVILRKALEGIDIAYYMIHSMGSGANFEDLDRISAENFREACIESGVKRVIYLGGLGEKGTASKHLLSRIETGEVLSARPDKLQVIWFRCGIIIGSGSASFEILRNLVEKLPIMVTPKWVDTLSQPISIQDALDYLIAAIDLETQKSIIVDIGVDHPISFRDMIKETAKAMGFRRVIIPIPVLTPRLSSYWVILFTPVPYHIVAPLIEGLKSETLVLSNYAPRYFPNIKPIGIREAVKAAIDEMVNDQVISRWCDSSAREVCDITGHDNTATAILRDKRRFFFDDISPENIFKSFTSIGGDFGWFTYNILWRIRGYIDKIMGGPGLNRGRRRSSGNLRVGDAIDFWKVADVRENERLLLFSQMKQFGKAWLEFNIEGGTLVQTAHYYPQGFLGRVYWFFLTPFHSMIFGSLGKKIIEHARYLESQENNK